MNWRFRFLILGILLVAVPLSAEPPIAPAVPALPVEPAEPVEPGYDGKPLDALTSVQVNVLAPKTESVISGSEVDFFFEVKNYRLAPNGNRLHVVLDNQSPIAVDSLKRPLTLRDLSEGGHTIRVFAVQPDGKLLRDSKAFAFVHFFVRKKDFQNYTNPELPYLTVNLPLQGNLDLTPEDSLWFDCLCHNIPDNSDAFRVRYRLQNIEGMEKPGKAVYWKNLKPGRYDFTAELVNREGVPVVGVFNRVSRTIQVRETQKAMPAEVVPQVREGD